MVRDYRPYGLRVRSAILLPFEPLSEFDAFEPDGTVHRDAVTAIARHVPAAWVVLPWHPFLLDALADRIKAYLRDLGVSRAGFACTEEGASGD